MTASETLRLKQEEWKAAMRTMLPAELIFFGLMLRQIETLIEQREAAAGDWKELPRVAQLEQFVAYGQIHALTGHAQALAVFDGSLALGGDDMVATVGGNILRIAKDWSIKRDAVDRALWREDCALTLVNVVEKADDEVINRTLDAAEYAVMAGFGTTDTVRPVLAVLGDLDATVAANVTYAGVKYLPLGNLGYHRMMSQFMRLVTTEWPA